MTALRSKLTSISLALVVLGAPAHARLQERPAAIASTQSKLYGYGTPVVVMAPGEEVSFVNLDIEMHDFVHDTETDGFGAKKPMPWCKKAKKKDAHSHAHGSDCPMFWTPLISLGEVTPIEGAQKLKSGTYSFICTIHHSMKGTLIVG